MIDPFGRSISYLRVSVTDRCDLRCVYCMAEDMTFLPRADVLSLEELDRLCGAFVALGVRKLRITGGEPLVRRDVMTLFRSLGARLGHGLEELTLTTNGTQLVRFAEDLAAAGVRRVNVSLDTLSPEGLHRHHALGPHREDACRHPRREGSRPGGQDHAVALKGVNEDEFDDMLAWCGREGLDLTLIETMPMGEVGDRTEQYLPLSMVRSRLRRGGLLTRRGTGLAARPATTTWPKPGSASASSPR